MISAIILAGLRMNNASKIVKELVQYPQITEIIICNPEAHLVWGRYEAMGRAKNEIIYTQDDDCLNYDIGKILEIKTDSVVYGVPQDYLLKIPNKTYGDSQLALIGWGALFSRKLISALDPYIRKYGKDDILFREADRIFTIGLKRKHTPVVCNIEHLPGYRSGLSSQPEHLETTNEAIRRALSLI
jgi:hypothetical protein